MKNARANYIFQGFQFKQLIFGSVLFCFTFNPQGNLFFFRTHFSFLFDKIKLYLSLFKSSVMCISFFGFWWQSSCLLFMQSWPKKYTFLFMPFSLSIKQNSSLIYIYIWLAGWLNGWTKWTKTL